MGFSGICTHAGPVIPVRFKKLLRSYMGVYLKYSLLKGTGRCTISGTKFFMSRELSFIRERG